VTSKLRSRNTKKDDGCDLCEGLIPLEGVLRSLVAKCKFRQQETFTSLAFSIEVADHADEPWPQQLKKQWGAAYCCARRLSCESKQMRWLNRTKRHRYSPIHWKRKHGCCRSEIGFASPTQGRFSTPSYISRAIFKSGARPLSHTYFLPFLVGFNSCIPGLTKGTQPKLTY
jgi:hypothetical protein